MSFPSSFLSGHDKSCRVLNLSFYFVFTSQNLFHSLFMLFEEFFSSSAFPLCASLSSILHTQEPTSRLFGLSSGEFLCFEVIKSESRILARNHFGLFVMSRIILVSFLEVHRWTLLFATPYP